MTVLQPHVRENDLSFEEVIAANEKKILNLLYGMTGDYHLAQDLAQETFLRAFKAFHTFAGKAAVSTWLYRIAVNVALDYQRKGFVRSEQPVEQIAEVRGEDTCAQDPDKSCQKRAIRDILFASIARLPEQQREVYILREINGCSTKEVAEILGCSSAMVKWRLYKARLALKKILQQEHSYKKAGVFRLSSHGIE
ncbi:RNA polymerase sigma factor [Carboxydocella sp. ULO1]|uniref:RNA polymerase sigma factor n=1 Tax=Carboxydocella sp. ULO1 TaxID=1926599 RepID=UPI0009AC74E1|nr:RNA polymerase sigma factor [Carboxydocella sp. ULO1]GAW27725.1 RNA polymerase subunit sigma-24 [Carboxydocella sp. ULO1]